MMQIAGKDFPTLFLAKPENKEQYFNEVGA
jgi:hypothetical protein